MRDDRTISAEEFLVESLDMKMRWLARQLRRTDNPEEIVQWITVVTSLSNIKQSLQKCIVQNTDITLKPFSEDKRLSISSPIRTEWQSNEGIMSTRSDTPIPGDFPALNHQLSSFGLRLPPCVELDERPLKKPKRTIIVKEDEHQL